MYRTYATASGADAHHDALLTNISLMAFDTGVDGLIGDQLLPAVPVAKQSDRYAIIDKADFLRNIDALRAPRTQARRVEFSVSSDAYFADNYALATDIALEDLANAQEIRIANLVTSISNVGSGVQLSGATQWSDFVNSDPIADVTTAHAFIQQRTGLIANTMVMDHDTMMIVRRHPDLLDMYKYTQGGMLNPDQLATVFGVNRILVGRSVRENSLEGGVTSMTNIWGHNVLLAYTQPSVGMETRTFGLRFQWRPEGFPSPLVASSRRDAGPGTKNVEIIQSEHFQAEKIVARELAYCIQNTVP
jgi:hypothetical protein